MAKINRNTTLTANAELNDIFTKLAQDYDNFNITKQIRAVRSIQIAQKQVSVLLAESALKDGTISQAKFLRIQNELNKYEKRIRDTMHINVKETIQDSADFATSGINVGFQKRFGGNFLSDEAFATVNENTIKYVANRFSSGHSGQGERMGLVLDKAIWGTSNDIRMAVEEEIKLGILTGMSVSDMIPRVRKASDAQTWQIKRLVKTEGTTAYRTATAMSAEESEVVEWVQIHKGLADKDSHMCNILAKATPYPMEQGPGIYKPTDTQIYSPHPNCTSFLTYVVDDAYTLDGLKERFGLDDNGDPLEQPYYDDGEAPKTRIDRSKVREFSPMDNLDLLDDHTLGGYSRELSDSEKAAIRKYTGSFYEDMNKYLRFGEMSGSVNIDSQVLDLIKETDRALAQYRLNEPIKVFRRIHEMDGVNFKDYIDAVFVDKGYASTTVIEGSFANSRPIQMEIVIPAGKGNGAWIDKTSKYKGLEREFLVPRGSDLLVTGVRDDERGFQVVEMELIPNDKTKE